GVYPITWAEGDQITVNGETSEPLAAADADTANAVFTFNTENLSAPYCVAYPAAEAGQVVFAAEQEYVDGTFANGAATMYGYATNGNITLNHLTGVLKIGVVCGEDVDIFDAPVIQAVKISTIDRAPIAGAFNIDFTTGAVTATDDAVSVITYNVNKKLSQNPTYLHVVVPAGVYNELYVTLEDEDGGVMYATVAADDNKPLVAGRVRTFKSDIVYTATDEEKNLVVRDYASLYTVKEIIETAEAENDAATLAKDITFVADVDINPASETAFGAWSSINAPNYKGTVKGNGYAINGLTQPLFNVTAASFKGLHLNVEIEETVNPNFGALARRIIANGNTPTVKNCSVSGEINIATDIAPETTRSHGDFNGAIGALVGAAAGVDFNDCVNRASVTITQLSTTKAMYCDAGGIVGVVGESGGRFANFTNCVNHGDITYDDATTKLVGCLGGILGVYQAPNATATFDNCSNHGDITTTQSSIIDVANIGGFIGYIYGGSDDTKNITFKNSTCNTGNLTFNGTSTDTIRSGGIVGYIYRNVTLTFNGETTNSGSITLNGTGTGLWLGGLLGSLYSSCTLNINKGYTNTEDGAITVNGATTKGVFLGGLYGYNEYDSPYSVNTVNISSRKIWNKATMTMNGSANSTVYVGGLWGFSHVSDTSLNKAVILNTGNLLVSKNALLKSILYMGGIAAYQYGNGVVVTNEDYTPGQVVNKAEVRFEGKVMGDCLIGGCYGQLSGLQAAPTINVGNIYVIGKIDTTKASRVGGYVGNISFNKGRANSNSQVYCDITAYCVAEDGTVISPSPSTLLIGMYTGSIASRLKAESANIKFGGRIATDKSGNWLTVDGTNYADYVVGERDCGVNYSGASPLNSKDEIDWGNHGN
ncbi:MAG: hypothetical protein IKY57_05415, partial [Alistipes sp.]|nr:hypothetical protein [Alistipes sp.]